MFNTSWQRTIELIRKKVRKAKREHKKLYDSPSYQSAMEVVLKIMSEEVQKTKKSQRALRMASERQIRMSLVSDDSYGGKK